MPSPFHPPEPIAVIGIGCRFPGGADTPEKFWKLLVDGVDAVAEMPADRFDLSRLFDANPAAAGRIYTRWGGFLENIDQFDAGFFGISPREAMRVDPQHRLLLETSWEALEDAGVAADSLAGEAVGVFVGISTHDYGDIQMYPVNRTRLDHHSNTGTAVSIAANRVSYFFDFRGPSLAVDTACSSALTAVHLAVNSLRSGECRMAIAGGVHIMLTPEPTMGFCRATMLSPTGRCRAFDSAADGYVRSEGAGVVLLKPLSAARADGDAVYAVLRSTVVNQDGKSASGLTVPSAASHQAMLQRALSSAGLNARDVQYVEAHGTGTPVGDPVEASALGAVLGRGRDAQSACVIGSVKTNIGHLEAASGIAGLVKTVLALSHREIPRSLHFSAPNPTIDFDALGLRVAAQHQQWPAPAALAVAGVNSFGFGGANAHAIVAEPPPDTRRRHGSVSVDLPATHARAQVLPLSARSAAALRALAREYAQLLRASDADAAAICGAAAHTRAAHAHRLAIIGATADEIADGLDAFLAGDSRANVISGKAPASPPSIAFAFSGMGPQWWGMARSLIRDEPIVRDTIERGDRALGPHAGWSIVSELAADEPVSRLREVEIAQTCGFAVQIALVELLKSWGVTPSAVFGHSAGELAAAYVAGAHDFDQLVLLVYHRSRLQARRSGYGRMLAAGVPAELVEPLIAGRDGVALAAVNGPASVTLSGDGAQLEAIAAELQQRSLFARFLPVDVPFHSAAMDPIRAELAQSIASLESRALTVPMVSTVTGRWADGAQLNPDYWWANVRQPVMFAAGTETLLRDGHSVFVEIGPHPVLAVSLRECVTGAGATATVLATLRRDSDDRLNLLRTIAGLYVEGVSPDWSKIMAKPPAHVRLPLYQWDRARHWFEPASSASWQIEQPSPDEAGHPLLQRRLRAALPSWETPLAHADLGWVEQHLVQGVVVFPAAGYLEAAIAASLASGREAVRLSRVAISRALVVSGEEHQLQVALDKDGSRFRIFSAASGGEWVRHAAGEIGTEHALDVLIDREELARRCTTEVPRDGFYADMAARGLQYGDAFKGLQEMWRGDDEALARIDSGESPAIDHERYRLHPALLDAALQLLFVAAPASGDETPPLYLPVAVDELRSYGQAGGALWAHARVRQSRAGRVVGDVRVFDASGLLRCDIRGLTCQRVDARAGVNGDSDWFYSYDWEPAIADVPPATPERHAFAEDAADALAGLRPRIDALAIEQHHRDYYDAERTLDRLAAAYSSAALKEAEGHIAAERTLLADRLTRRERQRPPADAPALLDRFAIEQPSYGIEAALLQRAGSVLGRNLRGDWSSVEELFSGAGSELLESFYLGAASMAFANRVLTETVRTLAAHFASTGRLRILEVGGGTGGSTPFVLAGLEPLPVDYTFTDVSPEFVRRAAERWTDRPELRTRVLDVERNPAPGDVAQFDLVVAANVVHATTDVAATLANLRRFLTPGGALVLLEITRRAEWLDIVFGQTRGWWKAGDTLRSDGYPLLALDAWQNALTDAGFVRTAALADSPPDGEPAQSVLIAFAPTSTGQPRGDWRVICDDDVKDVLQRGLVQSSRNGVMFVAAAAAASPDTDAWLHHQANVAASVLALAQQLRDADLWIVTTDSVDHAALWGLGRNLMLETRAVRCRLVEVESLSPENLDVVCRVVAGEFLELADEEELRITPRSIEVRRMQRFNVDAVPLREIHRGATADDEALQWRAEIDVPGSLESIAFRAATISPPGPHDITVRIDAASLNFRDVMLAMGMIPELESESSFGEQQLGLDAAGVVTACGAAVSDLRPGDRVVAIVPGAFAAAATTRAALAARCPADLPIEDAAAVPCVFATAQYALSHLARLSPGERVLIHSATGGVGLAALQIAQRAGAEIFATAGSDDKRAFLRQLGVPHVMDSRSLRFADEILQTTGGTGVDVVLNSLTGEALSRSLSLLRPSGRFVEIGKRDIYQNSDIGLLAFRKNLSFFAVDLDRLCAERPQLIAQLLAEVMAGFEEGTLRPLPRRTFPMRELEAALRVMGQAKHIGKLVLSADQPPLAASRHRHQQAQLLRADATYLVAGGVSGFGAVVAHWMSQRGARHLVLLSRRGEEGADADLIADMRAAGARVEVRACDVTRRRDVDAVLARIREQLPPLAGVFHAAMVLDDAPPEQMTAERFKSVMAPKMLGARHLDEATRESKLDHFVLFGSIAGIFGNDLQANYCAANAYLDSLAARRRRDGRPALVIDWGVLGDAGYVSRNAGVQDFLARHGYLAFNRAEALRVLEQGLSRDVTRLIAARIDWRHWADALPGRAASPRTRHLVPRTGAASATRSDWSRRIAGAATAAERLTEIETYLRQRLARILGAPNAAIEEETPLAQLGTDSLTGVELTTAIGLDLGVEIPLVRVLQGATLRGLASLIAEKMPAPSASGDSSARPASPSTAATISPPMDETAPAASLRAAMSGAAAEPPPVHDQIIDPPTATPISPAAGRRRRALARSVMGYAFNTVSAIEIEGREHLPAVGPYILAVNHLSALDVPLVMSVLPHDATLLAADYLQRSALVDRLLRTFGSVIYVARGEGDRGALEQSVSVLARGGVIALGPEGTRSATAALGTGHTGVAWIAAASGARVVPLVAWGQERLAASLKSFRRGSVRVRIGAPLAAPARTAGAAQLRAYTDDVMRALAALLPDEYRGAYAAPIMRSEA